MNSEIVASMSEITRDFQNRREFRNRRGLFHDFGGQFYMIFWRAQMSQFPEIVVSTVFLGGFRRFSCVLAEIIVFTVFLIVQDCFFTVFLTFEECFI